MKLPSLLSATIIAFGSLILPCIPLAAQAPDPGGALEAMMAVPPKYSQGFLLVKGNDGQIQPKTWMIYAKDDDPDSGPLAPSRVQTFKVVKGEAVAQGPSLNLIEDLRMAQAFSAPDIQVDSNSAFLTAESYAAANGRAIGSVNYTLSRSNGSDTALWTLDCFDIENKPIGTLVISATDGSVISSKGMPKTP